MKIVHRQVSRLVTALVLAATGCSGELATERTGVDSQRGVLAPPSIAAHASGRDEIDGLALEASSGLRSEFFRNDTRALDVVRAPYEMDVQNWLDSDRKQNRDVFAYKIFAALHMLGHDTYADSRRPAQALVLNKFQRDHDLPEQSLLDGKTLLAIDAALALREPVYAQSAAQWPHFESMLPLSENMVSPESVAHVYFKAMEVLPAHLQMDPYETLQCMSNQCLGWVVDAQGESMGPPIGLDEEHYVEAAYYRPNSPTSRQPSQAQNLSTVLHEYAHYLDGLNKHPLPRQPLRAVVDTLPFHELSFDMSEMSGCAPGHSDDPMDFISEYGFIAKCSGEHRIDEEFADAFAFYVASGRQFRAAAATNARIAAKYDFLRDHVFLGREYDTDLTQGRSSGCNDTPFTSHKLPGYMSCDPEYVWDGELPILTPGTPACTEPCDDGGVCTYGDNCSSGRCAGTTIPDCGVGTLERGNGTPADRYDLAQSFIAPARTVTTLWLYYREGTTEATTIRILDRLPPQGNRRGRADGVRMGRATVAKAERLGAQPGWVRYDFDRPAALTTGKQYYIFRSIPPGVFDTPWTWVTSDAQPFPGPYPDGTGYYLDGIWRDYNRRPADQNHYDFMFWLEVD